MTAGMIDILTDRDRQRDRWMDNQSHTKSCLQPAIKAGYMATLVACKWAGVVIEKIT